MAAKHNPAKRPSKAALSSTRPKPQAEIQPEFAPPLARTGPWPWLLLAGFSVFFFWDSFLAGKIFVMRDTYFDCFPWRVFGSQALLSGHLPLWNPYSLCGQPYIANPQTSIFYPLHLVFCLFPPIFALKFWVALHVFVGAASMYALARHWRLEPAPALLAGISFAFSTHLIAMLEFQSSVATEVFTPLALMLASMAAEASARREGFVPRAAPLCAALALVYATIYLAGHQQTMINGLFIVGIYLAARCLARFNPGRILRLGLIFAAAGALALALCLPQLLLMLELLPLSIRNANFDPGLKMASFHPVWMLGWLFPFIMGHPGYDVQWWGDAHTIFEFWAGAVYIGILPLICATAALAWFWMGRGEREAGVPTRRFLTAVFLGLGVFGLLLSFGQYTPLYMFFYNLPVFNKLRWPSKFLQLVMFAASVLAGLGFQGLLEAARAGKFTPARRLLIGWGGLFLVLALGSLFVGRAPGFFTWLTAGAFVNDPKIPNRLASLAQDWRMAALFLGLALALLGPLALGRVPERWRTPLQLAAVIVTFINLALVSRQVHPLLGDAVYRYQADESLVKPSQSEPTRIGIGVMEDMQQFFYGIDKPEVYRYGVRTLVGESALPHHVFRIHGGDVLKLAPYSGFKMLTNDANPWVSERALALMGVRYNLKSPPFTEVTAGHVPEKLDLTEIKGALPRALVAPNWRLEPQDRRAVSLMLDPKYDPFRTVLLAEAPPGLTAESNAVPPQPGRPLASLAEGGVSSIRYGLNRVDLTARAERDSMLLLNDVYYPGWRATVDGKPAKILRANFMFRAVPLKAGTHEVAFEYHPTRFYAGLLATLAALGAIVFLFIDPRRRQARS